MAAGFWSSEIRERPRGKDPGWAADALVCSPAAPNFFPVESASTVAFGDRPGLKSKRVSFVPTDNMSTIYGCSNVQRRRENCETDKKADTYGCT
jgi:hypothetical protein